jgi:hypothetical protein
MQRRKIISHSDANDIASVIKAGCIHPPEEYHEYATPRYVPDADDLMTAINCVFWASLEVEEGRTVLPRVSLGDVYDDLCRIDPVPLDVDKLRKLSPFLDDRRNFFQCTNTGGSLDLAGVGRFNPMSTCVHAERPGSIVVSHLGRAIAWLDNGRWSKQNLAQYQLTAGLQHIFAGENDDSKKIEKASLLIRIASLARKTRRGAMFISISSNRYDGMEVEKASCRISSFNSARDALVKTPRGDEAVRAIFSDDPQDIERHDELQEETRELKQFFVRVVASGSGIDGATLLDGTDFRVIAFGVKIATPSNKIPGQILSTRLPVNDLADVALEQLGGMRHQSAARLVDHNHDAYVVTVSQDGNVSLFMWDARREAVIALRGLENYLRAADEVYYA